MQSRDADLGEATGTGAGIARVYKAGSCHANDNIPGGKIWEKKRKKPFSE